MVFYVCCVGDCEFKCCKQITNENPNENDNICSVQVAIENVSVLLQKCLIITHLVNFICMRAVVSQTEQIY